MDFSDSQADLHLRTQQNSLNLKQKTDLQGVLAFRSNIRDLPHTARWQSNVMLDQTIFIHNL
jgi:hypothetical protein